MALGELAGTRTIIQKALIQTERLAEAGRISIKSRYSYMPALPGGPYITLVAMLTSFAGGAPHRRENAEKRLVYNGVGFSPANCRHALEKPTSSAIHRAKALTHMSQLNSYHPMEYRERCKKLKNI
jgi:hypothetical protein